MDVIEGEKAIDWRIKERRGLSGGSWRSPGYLEQIKRAQEFLHAGESYEVCLTDTYTAAAEGELYPPTALAQSRPLCRTPRL